MYRRLVIPLLLIMPLSSILAKNNITCIIKDDPIRRSFQNLTNYQGNKKSFDPRASGFEGNYVSFLADIQVLEKNAFITHSAEYIVGLDLRSKHIEEVEGGAFLTLFCLHHLDLSLNSITNIHQDVFQGLQNLRHLNLSYNSIQFVQSGAFTHLKNLQTLDLSHNKINYTDPHALDNLSSLENLYFNHNYIKKISEGLLRNMTSLKELNLNNNDIAVIYVNSFCSNTALEKLELRFNSIIIFSFLKACQLKSLTYLDVSDNMIMNLSIADLRNYFPNKNLRVDVNENPFSCENAKIYKKKFREFNIYTDIGAPSTIAKTDEIVESAQSSGGNGNVKTLVIVVLCLQFVIFVAFLYVKGGGIRQEIIRRFRTIMSDPSENVPLHPR